MLDMKTHNILLHTVLRSALLLLAAAALACTADPIAFDAGSDKPFDPVGNARPGFHSPLASADTIVKATVRPGSTFDDVITFGLPKITPTDLEVEFSLFEDGDWLWTYNGTNSYMQSWVGDHNENWGCAYLPAEGVHIPLGKKTIPAGKNGLQIPVSLDLSESVENYYQHLTVLQATYTDSDGETVTCRFYYQLRYDWIEGRAFDRRKKTDIAGFEEAPRLPYLTIMIDPSWLDPRCVREVEFERNKRVQAEGINETLAFEAVDAIALWGTTVNYDPETKMPVLRFDGNIYHLLRNHTKYLQPIQDDGIKVELILSGGGAGIGFCNLDDAQRASLVEQIRKAVVRYGIDGVNLYDEASAYGKADMPPVDPASYAKFIRDLRTAMPDKLITLTDTDEPSATLYEVHEGIEAGQYLDYAWTGKFLDQVDPYEAGAARKPIAGLDRSKYGLLFIRYRDYDRDWNQTIDRNMLLARKQNPEIPVMWTVELLPMVEGAEMDTGTNMLRKFNTFALPDRYMIPGGGRSDVIRWALGNEGLNNIILGASSIPNATVGLPSYGNMIYYPDWLRY